ncbi:Panacea domain-containing protein [Gordonia metallireducens]|uniref:Panacea domain-containing protein n=1 Tax=Gordonia metallireducens TaxID=2897779 RepID=UPI001E60288D|nr:Panacea domain-containing protein [Gordonia metallireducens]
MTGKPTALDVAQYVYNRLGWVDAWRLEKLTYFSQVWHLAWDGRPIFDDQFEAWPDGPVVRDLHRVNKYDRQGGVWGTALPGADPARLSDTARASIDRVLDFYGKLPKSELIALTHEDAPWRVARGGLADDSYSSEALSVTEMRRCYTAKVIAGKEDIPTAPPTSAVGVSGPGYAAAVARQTSRWAGALDLLADR